jgi:hypothetical protein
MPNALYAVIAAAALPLAAMFLGSSRWDAGTRYLRERLDAARAAISPARVDFRELAGLPAPVQRYFRLVLAEGQPLVASARVRHEGTFNMGDALDRWRPFTSDQYVVTQEPGFDWNGRIAMLPGLPVRVHDAYVAGEGMLQATLLGLFPLVSMSGGGDLAKGEFIRFITEAAWYPTALLPSQGARWKGVGDRSSSVTVTDGAVEATVLFVFNDAGLIDTVRAEARGRTTGGVIVPTPWQGRFWGYEQRGGMLVPLEGEVAWLLPEGPKPYWRGSLREILYEFAGSGEG